MLESLPSGFLSNALLHGMLQPLIIPAMASTSAVTNPSQSYAMPHIFTPWMKTPPGSPNMQSWKPPPRCVRITTSSPKMETPLESTGGLPQTSPPGCVEITRTLRSLTSQPLPAEEWTLPQLVGSTVVMSPVAQDMWGKMTFTMMTSQLNVMGLEPKKSSPTVTIKEMLAEMPILEDTSESDN